MPILRLECTDLISALALPQTPLGELTVRPYLKIAGYGPC